jgi:DNA modification methylase
MAEKQNVTIRAAKGRPMLSWVGKRPLRQVTAFPAQAVEQYEARLENGHNKAAGWSDWPEEYPKGGLLFHGDNKEVLAHLLANGFRGKVKLIYIDPPFDSGADYVRKVNLRGVSGRVKLESEGYTLGEQIQYTDIWANDSYLQFMYERLQLLKELLAEDGFIFLQCDQRKNHHLRCLLDEVFGSDNFRNDIISRRGTTSVQSQFENIDSLIPGYYTTLLYSKSRETKLPVLRFQRVATQPGKWDTLWRSHDRKTMRYELLGIEPQEGQWRWGEARARKAVANYEHYLANYKDKVGLDEYLLDHFWATGEMLDLIRLGPDETVQCYIPPQAERLANNVWMEFPHMGALSDYPTEKSEEMLRRVVEWGSFPGDIVLDCFIGSGTTAAVAQKLGRRWIGCDINKGAIQTTAKRLQAIIEEQGEAAKKLKQKSFIEGEEEDEEPTPAQLSFAVYRVNDYDLQIQHNEAVNLACEHLGVTRTRSDAYFDGTLGKRLVKIIPFGHPLSPVDLAELKRELAARPEEARDIAVVCLGKEAAVEVWLADWNRLRQRGDVPNKIQVIELRSDPKYGKFFVHQPAEARVTIEREGESIRVAIEDFISPTILERLDQQRGLVQPQIDDWRAMVDSVMIDVAYDGSLFNIALADVPEKKNDLVAGEYQLEAPAEETTVAVKITDMLGEEVVVTKKV